jgi:hypothetical protein
MTRTVRRRIVVGDRGYTWYLGRQERRVDGQVAVTLTLAVRIYADDDRRHRIEAVFRGVKVPFLFHGDMQNLIVTPRIVRRIIEVARQRGWPEREAVLRLDPAQDAVPDAVAPMDVADTELHAAASQWFVAYPGRAALQAAWTECDGDIERISERLGIEPVRLAGWLEDLGIRRR